MTTVILDEPTATFVDHLRRSVLMVQWCQTCCVAQGPGRRGCAWCGRPLSWSEPQQRPRAVATVWVRADQRATETGLTLVHLGDEAVVLGRVASGSTAPQPGQLVALEWADGDHPGVVVTPII